MELRAYASYNLESWELPVQCSSAWSARLGWDPHRAVSVPWLLGWRQTWPEPLGVAISSQGRSECLGFVSPGSDGGQGLGFPVRCSSDPTVLTSDLSHELFSFLPHFLHSSIKNFLRSCHIKDRGTQGQGRIPESFKDQQTNIFRATVSSTWPGRQLLYLPWFSSLWMCPANSKVIEIVPRNNPLKHRVSTYQVCNGGKN